MRVCARLFVLGGRGRECQQKAVLPGGRISSNNSQEPPNVLAKACVEVRGVWGKEGQKETVVKFLAERMDFESK